MHNDGAATHKKQDAKAFFAPERRMAAARIGHRRRPAFSVYIIVIK
jgi:hypothetical protein